MDIELAENYKNATFSKTYTQEKGFPFTSLTQPGGKVCSSFIFFMIICPWANNIHVFLQSLRRGEGTYCQSHRKKPCLWVRLKKHVKTTSLPTTEGSVKLLTAGSSVPKDVKKYKFIILIKRKIKCGSVSVLWSLLQAFYMCYEVSVHEVQLYFHANLFLNVLH